jgi:hypothetical protein
MNTLAANTDGDRGHRRRTRMWLFVSGHECLGSRRTDRYRARTDSARCGALADPAFVFIPVLCADFPEEEVVRRKSSVADRRELDILWVSRIAAKRGWVIEIEDDDALRREAH